MKSLVYAHSQHLRRYLAELLRENGYGAPLTAASSEEMRKALEQSVPQILLVAHEPDLFDALSVKDLLRSNRNMPAVFVTASLDRLLAQEAVAAGYASFLVIPAAAGVLHGAVVSALAGAIRLDPLLAKLEELEKNLSDRKVIEKAKGLLMERERISEEQAFRMLRGQSMKRRIAMSRIAEDIIEAAARPGLP